jgi:hypothetical protein
MSQKRKAVSAAALALFLTAGTAHAQKFERALGGPNSFEQAFDIDVYNANGGYVTIGDFVTGGSDFIQVVRFRSNGTRVWNRVYASEFPTTGYSIETAQNGDILVAGMTDTTAAGGLSTIVMRLDPAGNVLWSNRYAGTFGTDPIHLPQPGPALIENENQQIYVVTNFQGAPTAFRLRSDGTVVWSWIYFDPTANIGGERQNIFAFTDIKTERDGTLAISGTIRMTDPELGLPFVDLQDPMLLRIDRAGTPIVAAHYNLHPNQPIDSIETGDGLDVNASNSELVIAGRTGRPTTAPLAQHWVLAAPDFGVIGAANFAASDFTLDSTTGYSSVRYSQDTREFAVVGAFAPPGGEATIHGFDASGAPLWRWHSADQAQLDALVPAPSCGYLAAGRIGGFLTGGLDDLYHIKTNDRGETGCSHENDFFFEQLEPRKFFFPVEQGDAPFSTAFSVDPFEPFDEQPILCFDPECDPCLADWNGDGVLDFFDVQAFLADFAANNPNADINNDGVWDFFDVQAFLQAFSNGCP